MAHVYHRQLKLFAPEEFMKTITENDIETAINRLNSIQDNPMEQIFEDMDSQQNEIIDYLFEVEGDDLNEDERDLLIDTAVLGWYIVKEIAGCDKKISGNCLDSRLQNNIEIFEEKEEQSTDSEVNLFTIFSESNEQSDLMKFLTGFVIDSLDDKSLNVRDELLVNIMLHVKTIVDCLVIKEV